jgi:hypothetical protein
MHWGRFRKRRSSSLRKVASRSDGRLRNPSCLSAEEQIFVFSTTSRPVLEPNQFPVHRIRVILYGRWSGQRVKLTARLCILLNMSNCISISHIRLDGAVLYLRQGTNLLLPYTFSISTSSPRDIPLNKHHCCLPDLSFTATDEALLVFSKQTHPNTLQRFKKRPCLRSVFVNLPHHCDSNSSKRFLCVLSYTHRTPPPVPPTYAFMSVIDLAAWLRFALRKRALSCSFEKGLKSIKLVSATTSTNKQSSSCYKGRWDMAK